MKAKNPVTWFEIHVDNMERARKFYETVLNIQLHELPTLGTINADMEILAFPIDRNGSGAAGALVKLSKFKAGGNSTILYFTSEDCAIEEARIEKVGGKVLQPKQSVGEHGYMVLAIDTEGNTIGVHSMK